MMRAAGVVCLLVSSFGFSAPLVAQNATGGSIRGYVKDEQDAVLQGARLTASSPDAPSSYAAISNDDGYYRLLDLPPGTYTITAELDGFARWTRERIEIRAGLNIDIPVMMKLGTVNETVTVNVDSPLLESTSAATAVNISGELQRAVPLSTRRDWADFMSVTPGVVATQVPQFPNYFFHGSTSSSHVFQIDGVDVMSAALNNNIYIGLSNEAIGDVQIKTGGVDAASPLGVGAVVNVVTSSGTDRVRGSAALAYQPRQWNGNNTPGGTSATIGLLQPEFSVGGPLRVGRWWGFGSYRYNNAELGIGRTPQQIAVLRALYPSFEPYDAKSRAHLYFAKATGALSPKHQFTGFYQYDRSPSGGTQPTYATLLNETELGGAAYSTTLRSTWGPAITTVSVAHNTKGQRNTALNPDATAHFVHERAFLSSGRVTGTGTIATLDNWGFNTTDFPYRRTTVSADAMLFRAGRGGMHEIRSGYYWQRFHEEREIRYPRGGFFLEESFLRDPANPAAGTLPFHRRYSQVDALTTLLRHADDHAFYLQDLWRPAPRLSITAGLRADIISRRDRLFDTQTQRSIELGPRLGSQVSLNSLGTSTARVSWGRIHEAVPSTSAGGGAVLEGFRDTYDTDNDGVFETVFETPAATRLSPDRVFDPDLHQGFVDELIVGVGQQLPGQLTVDASWIRREYSDLPVVIETNGLYSGGVFTGYRNETLNEIGLVTNNTSYTPVYSALQLQAAQRTKHLELIGSYVRQWRHLAGTWLPNDPASFIQPDTFTNDRAIGGNGGDLATIENSYTVAVGQQWRDHAVRVGAAVQAPLSFTAAVNYTLQTGLWSGPILTRLAAADPRFGPSTVQLSTGRVVSNPLATPLRFAFPTRSDGQFTLPTLHILNLRIGRQFNFRTTRLTAALDVLNIPNKGANQSYLAGANQQFSANFRLGRAPQLPRSAQVSVRWQF